MIWIFYSSRRLLWVAFNPRLYLLACEYSRSNIIFGGGRKRAIILTSSHFCASVSTYRTLCFGYENLEAAVWICTLSLSSPAMGNDSSDGVTDKGEEGRKEGRNRRRWLSIGSGHTGNSSSSSSMSGCGAASAALVVLNNQRRREEIGVFSPLLVGVVLVAAPSCTTRQAQAVDLTLTLAAVVASKGEKVVSRIQGERKRELNSAEKEIIDVVCAIPKSAVPEKPPKIQLSECPRFA